MCQMGHILTYQKDFDEFISNMIHLSLVVELTNLIAGNGNFLKIDNWYVLTCHLFVSV
jgi:hypothetical protein